MNTLLAQLTDLILSGEMENKIFYIDAMPTRPDLLRVRCHYLSNSLAGIKFVNEITNEIEVVGHDVECEIAAK